VSYSSKKGGSDMLCFFDGKPCEYEKCPTYECYCKEEFEQDNDDDLEDYYDWDHECEFED
jgi:hypothetical protein